MELYVEIKKKIQDFELDVKFTADKNTLGLLGESGAGKSMTLRCIAGLEKPDSGKICLNNRVLFDSEKHINVPSRKRRIGFLFQNYALFPNMTVRENIAFALDKNSKGRINDIVLEKIRLVKLEGLENRYPTQLSGGQQQRVALARALAYDPEALLLDEPFSALDEHLRSIMVKQLMDTISNYQGVSLFVTHNMEEAYRVCSKLIVLSEGKVETSSSKEDLFRNPPTLAAAKLTGCKNFSEILFIDENEFEAINWGIRLKTNKLMREKPKFIGIDSGSIRLARKSDQFNIFEGWLCSKSEAPNKVSIYLSIGNAPKDSDDFQLQWEMTKEEWNIMSVQPQPWKICIEPDKILMLEK